jgi:hypothetical protein
MGGAFFQPSSSLSVLHIYLFVKMGINNSKNLVFEASESTNWRIGYFEKCSERVHSPHTMGKRGIGVNSTLSFP